MLPRSHTLETSDNQDRSSLTMGLRRTSRTKVAKNNSEFIYYSKYKEIGSATSIDHHSQSLNKKKQSKINRGKKQDGGAEQDTTKAENEAVKTTYKLTGDLSNKNERSNEYQSSAQQPSLMVTSNENLGVKEGMKSSSIGMNSCNVSQQPPEDGSMIDKAEFEQLETRKARSSFPEINKIGK